MSAGTPGSPSRSSPKTPASAVDRLIGKTDLECEADERWSATVDDDRLRSWFRRRRRDAELAKFRDWCRTHFLDMISQRVQMDVARNADLPWQVHPDVFDLRDGRSAHWRAAFTRSTEYRPHGELLSRFSAVHHEFPSLSRPALEAVAATVAYGAPMRDSPHVEAHFTAMARDNYPHSLYDLLQGTHCDQASAYRPPPLHVATVQHHMSQPYAQLPRHTVLYRGESASSLDPASLTWVRRWLNAKPGEIVTYPGMVCTSFSPTVTLAPWFGGSIQDDLRDSDDRVLLRIRATRGLYLDNDRRHRGRGEDEVRLMYGTRLRVSGHSIGLMDRGAALLFADWRRLYARVHVVDCEQL